MSSTILVCGHGPGISDAVARRWGSAGHAVAIVARSAAGLAIGKAAQHKTVGLLGAKLGPDGVYVGEVVVTGTVKGTAFDTGTGGIDPATIADKFWQLAQARTEASVIFG